MESVNELENTTPEAADQRALVGYSRETPMYGGQALIEGVLMRGPRYVAAAFRRANGDITVKDERVVSRTATGRIAKRPFIRGVFALFETLSIGMRYLQLSGELAAQDAVKKESEGPVPAPAQLGDTVEGPIRSASAEATGGLKESALPETGSEGPVLELAQDPPEEGAPAIPKAAMISTMIVAFALGIGLFVFVPNWLAGLLESTFLPGLSSAADGYHLGRQFTLNVIEAGFRILVLLGYILAIGLMPDIRRVFQYHGAEHRIVHALEAREPLTVESGQHHSSVHPRCGTNFLVIVILVSIVVFSLFKWDNILERIAVRLLTLPVIIAVAYEVLKLAGRLKHSWLMRILVAPGLAMQWLTTRTPTDDQVEVAARAMGRLVELETAEATVQEGRVPAPARIGE